MPETKKVNPTGTVKAAQPRQQEAAAGKKSLQGRIGESQKGAGKKPGIQVG
jgi:hypothetical protein